MARMDSQFSDMIHEDHSETANLPKEVMMKKYPKCSYMDRYELDDTMRGLDDTRNYDIRKVESEHSDVKY